MFKIEDHRNTIVNDPSCDSVLVAVGNAEEFVRLVIELSKLGYTLVSGTVSTHMSVKQARMLRPIKKDEAKYNPIQGVVVEKVIVGEAGKAEPQPKEQPKAFKKPKGKGSKKDSTSK